MNSTPNQELQLATNFINKTDCNIFLTGKAGTGKTTFLHNLHKITHKRFVVVAPTGVAAVNAKGVTIHSFFQIGFGIQIPSHYKGNSNSGSKIDFSRYRKERKDILRSLDLLVIDEISMVRADLLDAIDMVLRQFKKRHLPFGGVQLLMIGDMNQLEPIMKDDEWSILKEYYDTKFFFSSLAIKQTNFVSIELTKIYRQTDQHFIDILNQVRTNNIDQATLHELNKRYQPNFEPPKEDNYIILTTHNAYALSYNEQKLKALKTTKQSFSATVRGDFPENSYPTEFQLELRVGAQVMFIKNDSSPDKLYYNGKIGEITEIDEDTVIVKCKNDTNIIEVKKEKWENTRYTLNEETKEIEEEVVGSFTQIPLKLAWAITIHKSQGLTFEKAIIDASQSFTFGQVYVALSRCKSLEGMVLNTPITTSNILSSPIISQFSKYVESNHPTDEQLEVNRLRYQSRLLQELFNFSSIKYLTNRIANTVLSHSSAVSKHYTDFFLELERITAAEIITVAEKFGVQISSFDTSTIAIEQNQVLQERIKKSVPYFTQKLTDIILTPIEKTVIDIDNKAVKEQMIKEITQLATESSVKRKALLSASDGFSVDEYLKAINIATLDETLTKTITLKNTKISADLPFTGDYLPPHPPLYHALRKFARDEASRQSKQSFMILDKKTTEAICNKLPRTTRELEMVKGMGKAKIAEFGDVILSLTTSYLSENKHLLDELPEPEQPKIKAPKKDTKLESFTLFKSGMTIDEIATTRGFVSGTILGHLFHYVELGEIDIEQLIDAQKLKEISELIIENKEKTLSEIKTITQDKYSYNELKIAKELLKADL